MICSGETAREMPAGGGGSSLPCGGWICRGPVRSSAAFSLGRGARVRTSTTCQRCGCEAALGRSCATTCECG